MKATVRWILASFVAGVPLVSATVGEPTSPLKPDWAMTLEPVMELEAGWHDPPLASRARCWWWWLNGNVTKAAITRDLEEMKKQGLGGANIVDAGGADQRGHRQVPHGPDFASPQWQELFEYALREADRLGLQLGLNIQSGWNLGGPAVTPEQAAKKLTWAESTVAGEIAEPLELPQPATIGDFYRDVAVLAIRVTTTTARHGVFEITSDRSQPDYPPAFAVDGDRNTFWVSGTFEPGTGPSAERPVRLEFEFASPVTLSQIVIHPRNDYGPRRGWIQGADNPENWRILGRWTAAPRGPTVIDIPRTTARRFRLVIVDAYDPRSPLMPRNAQIAEVELRDDGNILQAVAQKLARVDNYQQKAYHQYPGAFTAVNADHLLVAAADSPDDRPIRPTDVVDLTDRVTNDGALRWRPPPGTWKILRLGYTLSGAHVSTSSEGWNGWAIDYLDPQAFEEYWGEVLKPLLDRARPYLGRTLVYLHTDSWELGPVNWTPRLIEEFRRRRGYDPTPFLPVLAGYVVEDRLTSNRFLNDFRRTLADLIADGKYATFREYAHRLGLGIHPESGGPHAAPIDALLCLSRSDIPMGEFWARSATHRVRDQERFFTKQPASAAHIYGRRYVMAESFTSIGPHWEESPADLKPVFDQAACEGLNLVMLHTFDCSPEEMGRPGQAYFAGTHVNPNTTWWHCAGAFFDYLNRCQFLLQQGLPVADVLYFYGENVPSFVRLKADDPARVLPGYDYDVINSDALRNRTSVVDGRIVLPEGTSYRLLVLPPGDSYGLEALERIAALVDAGATVIGPRPKRPIGRTADPEAEVRFDELAERLWSKAAVEDVATRDRLRRSAIPPDFLAFDSAGGPAPLDFVHRRTDAADVYFVANRSGDELEVECSFRIVGRQPELWNPVTGEIVDAEAFWQTGERTVVPLCVPPYGSIFVVFRRSIPESARGRREHNEPRSELAAEIDASWDVRFDTRLGGPADVVQFERLISWPTHASPSIKYYSGPAVYRTTFDVAPTHRAALDGRRWWLDLGEVRNIARVTLNGDDLGVAWTRPFRVELTGRLRDADNELEIEVTNLWPNRLIGDAKLPPGERLTETNITKFDADSPLLASGLLGPVQLLVERSPAGPPAAAQGQ